MVRRTSLFLGHVVERQEQKNSMWRLAGSKERGGRRPRAKAGIRERSVAPKHEGTRSTRVFFFQLKMLHSRKGNEVQISLYVRLGVRSV